MNDSTPESTPEAAAAAWLAKQDAGFTPADEQAFDRWLLADPRNAEAWEAVESTWAAYDDVFRSGAAPGVLRDLAARQHRRRWRVSIGVAAGLAAAAAAAVLVVFNRPAPAHGGTLARVEQRVLADGSRVELSSDAIIEVNYEPAARRVQLRRGVALFTVAKNAARPFIVSTGRVSVRAVGTAFTVETGDLGIDVVVTEGRVAVAQGEPATTTTTAAVAPGAVFVSSGQRLIVPAVPTGEALQPQALSPADLAHTLAWREPRIELDGTSLADAAELFNHENRIQLSIVDRALGRLKLSGVYRADDPEGFVRLLVANYEVTAEHRGDVIELRGK